MSLVVTLTGYKPSPRFDAVPWASVNIQEAAIAAGPWTTIDTQALSPLDLDPRSPAVRNFTTSHATLDAGWYRIVFLDAGSGEQFTQPVFQGGLLASMTGQDIRDAAPPDFPWARLQFPAPAPGDPDLLDVRVRWASGYVEATTFRPLSSILPPPGPNLPTVEIGATVNLVPLAEQAIVLATLQQVAQQSKRYITATVLEDYLSSFTAGSYSEQRAAADTVLRSRGSVENPLVNRWRALSDLLYLLMTPDAYSYWRYRLSGVAPPAGGFTAQDWGDGGGRGRSGGSHPSIWGPGVEAWPVGW